MKDPALFQLPPADPFQGAEGPAHSGENTTRPGCRAAVDVSKMVIHPVPTETPSSVLNHQHFKLKRDHPRFQNVQFVVAQTSYIPGKTTETIGLELGARFRWSRGNRLGCARWRSLDLGGAQHGCAVESAFVPCHAMELSRLESTKKSFLLGSWLCIMAVEGESSATKLYPFRSGQNMQSLGSTDTRGGARTLGPPGRGIGIERAHDVDAKEENHHSKEEHWPASFPWDRGEWPGSNTPAGGGKQVGQALREERQAEGKHKELWDVMDPDQAIQGLVEEGRTGRENLR